VGVAKPRSLANLSDRLVLLFPPPCTYSVRWRVPKGSEMFPLLKRLAATLAIGLAVCTAVALPVTAAYAGGPCSSGTHWDDITRSCL